MEMGQQVLNKESNEIKKFIEAIYPKCWMQIL